MDAPAPRPLGRSSPGEIFQVFLRLGLTSFGGPIAHLGFFRAECVQRRGWVDEKAYADLVALCQFLPGPASSQVGMALGYFRGGLLGSLAAWAGFTLPSAVVLAACGVLIAYLGPLAGGGWLHGLKVVSVAVVAQALWGMARSLCPDRQRATIALAATVPALLWPGIGSQLAAIAAGGLLGWAWLTGGAELPHSPFPIRLGARTGLVLLIAVAALLAGLPILAAQSDAQGLRLFDRFFRAGALVFGGGHVVLPLLQAEVVGPGWVSSDSFLAGYGLAQAVPGPLFTFAAYLGAASRPAPSGWLGASIAVAGIFLPGYLLVIGALPLWERVRRQPLMQRAMLGVNAAVVGLLLAAFYDPVWARGIGSAADFALALAAFIALVFWNQAPWRVVLGCALLCGLGS